MRQEGGGRAPPVQLAACLSTCVAGFRDRVGAVSRACSWRNSCKAFAGRTTTLEVPGDSRVIANTRDRESRMVAEEGDVREGDKVLLWWASGNRDETVFDDPFRVKLDRAVIYAVSDVSFAVDGGVTALLGPNGAGKSTLFRMMCGLTPPSRGTVDVLGHDPRDDRDVRGRISLVPQQDALFDHLSAAEFLEFAARTQGMADPVAVTRHALELVDLADVGSKPVGQFSKGMRQRVGIAQAIVHDPEVLILDEPTAVLAPMVAKMTAKMMMPAMPMLLS